MTFSALLLDAWSIARARVNARYWAQSGQLKVFAPGAAISLQQTLVAILENLLMKKAIF
jgi:hypothetical protein